MERNLGPATPAPPPAGPAGWGLAGGAFNPSPASLARRAELARVVSSLKRVRSRTPFFRLPAHTVPTLWGLYRGLLREAPSYDIRWRMRRVFEKNRSLTGTEKTIALLKQGYKYLDAFKKARAGDVHLQAVLARYSRLIAAKRENEDWKQVLRSELAWNERLSSKPILTGSLLRPSLDNPPMPRLFPQPDHIDPLIRHRRAARERRFQRLLRLQEEKMDLMREAKFEEEAARESSSSSTVFGGPLTREWTREIDAQLVEITQAQRRATARLHTPISPELYATLKAARTFKIENKTREREGARRGVYTQRVLKRMRVPAGFRGKGVREDVERALRAPGEGGWTGRVKRERGVRTRGGDGWRRENEVGEEGKVREKLVRKESARRAARVDREEE